VVKALLPDEKRRYCKLLLSVLWNSADRNAKLFSMFSGKRRELERRMDMILNSGGVKGRKRIRLAATSLTLALALGGAVAAYAALGDGGAKAASSGTAPSATAVPASGGNPAQPAPSAAVSGTWVAPDTLDFPVLKGEPGTIIHSGDLIYERVDSSVDEVSSTALGAEAQRAFEVTLAGNTNDIRAFDLSGDYRYAKLRIRNDSPGSLVMTITADSPTGAVVKGSIVRVSGKSEWIIYRTGKWPKGLYYLNLTSGSYGLHGEFSCVTASSKEALNIP